MNIAKILTATTIALTLLAVVMPTAAQAETSQEQKLNQEVTITCESTGSYGQDQKCVITNKQTGEQRQVLGTQISLRDGVLFHKPVDTALDTFGMLAGSLTLVGGTAAYIIKRKIA